MLTGYDCSVIDIKIESWTIYNLKMSRLNVIETFIELVKSDFDKFPDVPRCNMKYTSKLIRSNSVRPTSSLAFSRMRYWISLSFSLFSSSFSNQVDFL